MRKATERRRASRIRRLASSARTAVTPAGFTQGGVGLPRPAAGRDSGTRARVQPGRCARRAAWITSRRRCATRRCAMPALAPAGRVTRRIAALLAGSGTGQLVRSCLDEFQV